MKSRDVGVRRVRLERMMIDFACLRCVSRYSNQQQTAEPRNGTPYLNNRVDKVGN